MSTERPTRVGVAQSPRELLVSAAERVSERIDELYPPLAPGGPARAEAYLETLLAKMGQVIRGEDPEPIRSWLHSSTLYEPLMDALGRELVHAVADSESAASALVVLRAWFALRPASGVTTEARPEEPEDLDDPAGRITYADGHDRWAWATYDPTAHLRAAAVLDFHAAAGLRIDVLHAVNRRQVARIEAGIDALDASPAVLDRDRDVPLGGRGGFVALRSPIAGALRAGPGALRARSGRIFGAFLKIFDYQKIQNLLIFKTAQFFYVAASSVAQTAQTPDGDHTIVIAPVPRLRLPNGRALPKEEDLARILKM